MRITKYVHSCLLVEAGDSNVLFDPGVYSYQSGIVDIPSLPPLDYIVITHEHPDHYHLPFVRTLCEHSPKLTILTTKSVANQLKGQVQVKVTTKSEGNLTLFATPHEFLPAGQPPENIGVHLADLFTDPGDSHSFKETKPILAMPMTAPWGSMTDAVKKIRELKPKTVIPVHDWHWRPEALAGMYSWFQEELNKDGIDFKVPVDGEPIEL